MKLSYRFLLVVCVLLAAALPINAQDLEWAVVAAGMNQDAGTALTTDEVGNIYMAGDVGGSATFGKDEPGEEIVTGHNFIAKYYPDGTYMMAISILSDAFPLQIEAIDVDTYGNIYIAGEVTTGSVHTFGAGEPNEAMLDSGFNSGDVFLAKFDASGTFEWVRSGGTSEINRASDIAVDADGSSYITGFFRSSIELGADGTGEVVTLDSEGGVLDNDVFIAKYDTYGDLVWAYSAGGAAGSDSGRGIEVDDKSNVYLIGAIIDEATFGKNTKFETQVMTGGGTGAFMARFDPRGALRWVVPVTGGSFSFPYDIEIRQGKSVIVGTYDGTIEFQSTSGSTEQQTADGPENVFIARYDRSGRLLWSNSLFASELLNGVSVSYWTDQRSCILGNFDTSITFDYNTPDELVINASDYDQFFGCYSKKGAFLAAASDPVAIEKGTAKPDGTLIVTGRFQNSVTFGDGDENETMFTSAGSLDAFLAAYSGFPRPGSSSGNAGVDGALTLQGETPASFLLQSNYPNPFNPQTTLRFDLPETAEVSLNVFDMQGRLVRKLAQGTLEEGSHEVIFNADNLPSGAYLYRLVTPVGVQSRIMTLLK